MPSSKPVWDSNGYVAQLQLDSTTLVITELAHGLEVPWDLEPGPDDWIYLTEQKGKVSRLNGIDGTMQDLGTIEEVFYRKSSGLFSLVLHPDFENKPYIYFHYTVARRDSLLIDHISSKVVRYTLVNGAIEAPKTILDQIPGNTYHNGSRMKIWLNMLWIGTGDAGDIGHTQDPNTLNGKILRVNLDGSIPSDNPYPNNPVWSMGHRNIQGLAEGNGKIYASEHGPNNDDEINLIQKNHNYGWPEVQGFCDLENEKAYCQQVSIVEPMMAWTPTIAPSGLAFYDNDAIPEWKNSLMLTTLKGQSFRVLALDQKGDAMSKEHLFLQKFLGRLRDVAVGKDGAIYLATSNMDWHEGYQPWLYDSLPKSRGDRIIKIQAADHSMSQKLTKMEKSMVLREERRPILLGTEQYPDSTSKEALYSGKQLYVQHCAACHATNGEGNPGQLPPLVNSEWVSGNSARLIDITLTGLNDPIIVDGVEYQGEMPSYQNLSDVEISDILNYIRIEFGKTKGNIRSEDVFHQRKGLR
jgi:glucose/arabinose dehydrogenase/mono/diheme cytochrome c family protein